MLSWKDAFTTLLAIVTYGIFYISTKGTLFPFINNPRIAVILIGVVGITMCAIGSKAVYPPAGVFSGILSALGFASLVLILCTLITGSKTLLLWTTVMILFLWLVTTIRHGAGL